MTQFSNLPTCSVVPTIGGEFVNKGYVDSLVGQYSGGYNMFFNYSVTDGSYKQLGNTIVDVSQNQIDITTTDSTRQLVEQFVSSALNITTIPVGIWNVLLYGTVSSAAANVRYTCDIHTLDGVTLSAVLATSSQSEDINAVTTPAAYTMNITLATAITCLLTTKLVVRLFVRNVGSTVPLTVSTYFQNMYYSFIQTSLNEGTTLLTSNNNWTGSNTFLPITPSSSTTYNASTGTPAGTIGNILSGTFSGGALNQNAREISVINIEKNGVYQITYTQSYLAATNGTLARMLGYIQIVNNVGGFIVEGGISTVFGALTTAQIQSLTGSFTYTITGATSGAPWRARCLLTANITSGTYNANSANFSFTAVRIA